MNPEITRLLAAKQQRRHRLASLPFPEKVRAIARLQEMAAPLLRRQGKLVSIWRLDP